MTTEITRLLTRTGAPGERTEFILTLDGGGIKGSRFSARYGTARRADGAEVDCLYKVASGDWGRRAIENEIAVLSGLGWAGMDDARFPELLGHDLDPEEGGAVLVQTRRGRALSQRGLTGVPTAAELWQPAHDLLSALKVLADHRYVHGAISSTTVFWDGEGLQIADLSTATTQTVDDDQFLRDVRHVAGLLYWLATNEESSFGYVSGGVTPEEEYRHLTTHRPDLALILQPLYEGESPTAAELLARMGAWPRPVSLVPRAARDQRPEARGPAHDDETTRRYGDTPGRAEPGDRAHRQFRRNFAEMLGDMHPVSDRPGNTRPPSGRAVPRDPRPEPGTPPSLPPLWSVAKDFLLRVTDHGMLRPHPLIWVGAGIGVGAVLTLLVVF